MQLGMIGLGRMGANIVRRLMRAGHACVVHDVDAASVQALAGEGATASASLAALVAALATPRVVWIMVPAAAVEETVARLVPLLARGDMVIDGGNSHYVEDIRRARELAAHGIAYLDVGTSGGVWGLEQGYCLMVGGDEGSVRHVAPIFEALAPGEKAAAPTASRGREGTAQRGWLHCGAAGAGHFVKMVHNGIEYGVMAAFAEGFNLMRHANAGSGTRGTNAETAPLAHPGHFLYDLDVAEVAEVWRRGSVVRSWLLDLVAEALAKDPHLERFEGFVSDSGEGRWTVNAAVEASVPVPVLSAALFARFSSRGEDDFANRLLSAMRREFGGHGEVLPQPDRH